MSSYLEQQLQAAGSCRVFATVKRGHNDPERIKKLARHFDEDDLTADIRRRPGSRAAKHHLTYYPNLGIVYGTVKRKGWRGLMKEPALLGVDAAPAVRPVRLLKSESIAAPGAGAISWGIERLGIPKLWDKGLLGRGVLVGHLDSGVDDKHPALQGAVVEFIQIDDAGQPVAAPAPFDSERHGTMTAGIIAARHLGGRTVGVAPEAHLASAMVFDGGDLVKRLLAGIEWAIEKKVRIISASVGVPGFWPQFVPVIRQLRKLGILPVFAAGNDGPGVTRAPANCPQCLSVGAIAQDDSVLADSSSARMPRSEDPFVPDLVTPGDEIVTTDLDEGFRLASGTSMAAPHVSGLAALLLEAKPESTVDEIERVIFRSCVRTNSEPRDRANRGVPDALVAWESLTKTKVARTRAAS